MLCYRSLIIIVLFVETPRKFITAKLSIRKPGSSSVLIIWHIISTDERIESFAVINLRGVSTNKTITEKICYKIKNIRSLLFLQCRLSLLALQIFPRNSRVIMSTSNFHSFRKGGGGGHHLPLSHKKFRPT
jgi:hypothetical protein